LISDGCCVQGCLKHQISFLEATIFHDPNFLQKKVMSDETQFFVEMARVADFELFFNIVAQAITTNQQP
jgi:hypothetical protein